LADEARVSRTLVVRRRAASTVIYSIDYQHLHEWCWYLAGAHLRTRST
jgi:hypothetical protein